MWARGLYLQAIAVEEFQPLDQFEEQVETLRQFISSGKPAQGFTEVLLPGDRSRREEVCQRRDGVVVEEVVWKEMLALASEAGLTGVPTPLPGPG